MGKKVEKFSEIRIVRPNKELLAAIQRRALIENRTITNVVETILLKEFRIKPVIKNIAG